ncbi:MAG TPA: SDR family oxidoreductase [Candidatus Acidoferrales bacterium]|nr:SDR family oxidoreductase [Candidatus Acidoferrales bacterium]
MGDRPTVTALVTGGGRGIGQGIAVGLVKAGMRVAVTARSADQLAETVDLAGGGTIAVAADVADPAAVRAMVREVERRLGPVDLLVNNAGTAGPYGPLWESDPEAWWRCLEVNLRGPYLCCREVLPGMIARRSGRIVNVASGAGVFAIPDMSAYVASKTALVRLSEQLAQEAGPYGVKVFPIRPGVVRTAMAEEGRQRIPLVQKVLDDGLDVTPQVVAELVLYLASGRADALSGRLFSVNDDVEGMVRRADAVEREELYLLRSQRLGATG